MKILHLVLELTSIKVRDAVKFQVFPCYWPPTVYNCVIRVLQSLIIDFRVFRVVEASRHFIIEPYCWLLLVYLIEKRAALYTVFALRSVTVKWHNNLKSFFISMPHPMTPKIEKNGTRSIYAHLHWVRAMSPPEAANFCCTSKANLYRIITVSFPRFTTSIPVNFRFPLNLYNLSFWCVKIFAALAVSSEQYLSLR